MGHLVQAESAGTLPTNAASPSLPNAADWRGPGLKFSVAVERFDTRYSTSARPWRREYQRDAEDMGETGGGRGQWNLYLFFGGGIVAEAEGNQVGD